MILTRSYPQCGCQTSCYLCPIFRYIKFSMWGHQYGDSMYMSCIELVHRFELWAVACNRRRSSSSDSQGSAIFACPVCSQCLQWANKPLQCLPVFTFLAYSTRTNNFESPQKSYVMYLYLLYIYENIKVICKFLVEIFDLQVTKVIATVYLASCQNRKNNEISCDMSCDHVYQTH